MIVISGACFLVAAALLVLGIASDGLGAVYASIALSLVAFAALLVGVLQRRGQGDSSADDDWARADDGPGAGSGAPASASAPAGAATSVRPAGSNRVGPLGGGQDHAAEDGLSGDAAPTDLPSADDAYDDDAYDDDEYGGTVLVVPGRPRYHVDGCRYLAGKDLEEVDVLDAREEGFTACGVCRPDEVLEAELQAELSEQGGEPAGPPAAGGVTGGAPPAGSARAARSGHGSTVVAPAPAPLGRAEVAPGAAASAHRAVEARVPVGPSVRSAQAPVTPAAERASGGSVQAGAAGARPAAGAASAAATLSVEPGNVVVIPDRGKHHRANCRYVRDAPGRRQVTRAVAEQQGFGACGVCRP